MEDETPSAAKLNKEAKAQKKVGKQSKRAAHKATSGKDDRKPDSSSFGPALSKSRAQGKESYAIVKKAADPKESAVLNATDSHLNKTVALFDQVEQSRSIASSQMKDVHPSIAALGLRYTRLEIVGSDSRVIAMLRAFRTVIHGYHTPAGTVLSRNLTTYLSPQIEYLKTCRPLSVTMRNAIRWLKLQISVLSIDLSDDDAKTFLVEHIENFIRDRVTVAAKVIGHHGASRIHAGDHILIYACSTIVRELLLEARNQGTKFRLTVVDSRPLFEARQVAHDLTEAGIDTTYIPLSALHYAMRSVDKVLLGAHAMLSNGSLYSRAGTAMVAMAAKELDIPVIVCCETLKFTDRVGIDAFVLNELGSPEELASPLVSVDCSSNVLGEWKEVKNLKLLNFLYDVTPASYIRLIITEMGCLPTSSVPIVLREYKT